MYVDQRGGQWASERTGCPLELLSRTYSTVSILINYDDCRATVKMRCDAWTLQCIYNKGWGGIIRLVWIDSVIRWVSQYYSVEYVHRGEGRAVEERGHLTSDLHSNGVPLAPPRPGGGTVKSPASSVCKVSSLP